MGIMKQYLMEKTSELAGILGIPEEDFYLDQNLSNIALCYAQCRLQQRQKITDTREEIKTAILTRTDEVVELIQGYLRGCYGYKRDECGTCPNSFLCENSTQYIKEV